MRTRLLFVLTLIAFAICATAAENKAEVNGSPKIAPPVNRENPEIKPLKPFNSHGLALTFSLEATQFPSSKRISGNVTLKCVGNEGFNIYNPFFHDLQVKPGDVRIFDSAGKLVSNLLESDGGSMVGDDRIMVYPGDLVGTRIEGWPSGVPYPMTGLLPPGKYKAQFVLFSYVVRGAEQVSINSDTFSSYYTKVDKEFLAGRAVIAASKQIPFEIVAKGSSGASTSQPAAH